MRVKAMGGFGCARRPESCAEAAPGGSSNSPANIFSGDDELSGLNCFTRGVGRAPSQE